MPPSRSPASCSAKIAWRLGGVHGAERGHQLAGRAEVAGHEGAVLVGHLAREPGTRPR